MFSTVLKHGLETIHGVSVTHCPTFAAARRAIEAEPGAFSLAVLDLNLPEMDGIETLQRAKQAGIGVVWPAPVYCTDNAAMIGAAALDQYTEGDFADLYLNAEPRV